VQSEIKMRAVAIAALLAATPALAQEVPTPLAVSTDSSTRQSGTLDSPTDTALYSVYLSTNQVVAIGIHGDGIIMDLLDRSKKPIKQVEGNSDYGVGLEYKALATGTYYLKLSTWPGHWEYTDEEAYYAIWAEPDCLGTIQSTCGMKEGIWQERYLTHGEDKDAMRVKLAAGKTYDFKVEFEPDALAVEIRNSKNKIMKVFNGEPVALTFKPTASGYYWLTVIDHEWEYSGRYRTYYKRR
jgi:hypothetical protein